MAGKIVYIAGPYTKGDVAMNVREAIMYAKKLLENGFIPFVPHLSHFWDMIFPKDHDEWLEYDLQILSRCDIVLRIPGKSSGAKREIKEAKKLGIPVYDDLQELILKQ